MVDPRKVRVGCNFSMDRINKLEPNIQRRKIFIHYLKTYAFSLEHLHQAFIDCDVLTEWTCSCCNEIIFNKYVSQDGEILCKKCTEENRFA